MTRPRISSRQLPGEHRRRPRASLQPERLRELLALGWLESRTEGSDQFFRDADIYRVRKLERICCDFELPVVGGTIIVDLLERIDALEHKVRELQGLED